MSRCFPYLGIANRVRDESLIDSIKPQSHKRKAEQELTNEKEKKQRKLEKKQRKLEKKEKKQRKLEKKQRKLEKKEKREKKKASKAQALLDGPLKTVAATKLADQTPSTEIVAQVESREGSGLTEEHGKPFEENLCYLSDGTQKSNKRPGEALSSEDSQEPNDVKMSHLASTSTSTSTPNHEKLPEKISSMSTSTPKEAKLPQKICSTTTPPKVPNLPEMLSSTTTPKVAKLPEKISSTVTPKVARLPEKISGPTTPTVAKLSENISRIADDCAYNDGKKQKQERFYKALFEDWVPIALSLSSEQDDGDDWLLLRKQKHTQMKRTRTYASDITSLYNGCRNRNLFGPKACYLPAADIYAFPYTLPF